MEESLLLKIALSFSLLGLIALLLIVQGQELEETPISNLTVLEQDTVVRLKGVVSSVDDRGNILNIELAQPQTVEVVFFKSHEMSLKKGAFVEITGEIRDYKGKKEIIATQLEVLE